MRTYSIELSGTITRDIIWREVDAENEDQVRAICAQELPSYRVRSVIPVDHSMSGADSSPSPMPNDESLSTSSPPSATAARSKP